MGRGAGVIRGWLSRLTHVFLIRDPKEMLTSLMKVLPDSKGQALFYFWPWTTGNSKRVTSVYRVDTYTGRRTQLESFDDSYSWAWGGGGGRAPAGPKGAASRAPSRGPPAPRSCRAA